MSTNVTLQPEIFSFLVVALSFVAEPSGWLNWPYQRSTLASKLPPAPITVMRPGPSPFTAGIENSVSIIPLFGCTRCHPCGASRERVPSAIVNAREAGPSARLAVSRHEASTRQRNKGATAARRGAATMVETSGREAARISIMAL